MIAQKRWFRPILYAMLAATFAAMALNVYIIYLLSTP